MICFIRDFLESEWLKQSQHKYFKAPGKIMFNVYKVGMSSNQEEFQSLLGGGGGGLVCKWESNNFVSVQIPKLLPQWPCVNTNTWLTHTPMFCWFYFISI